MDNRLLAELIKSFGIHVKYQMKLESMNRFECLLTKLMFFIFGVGLYATIWKVYDYGL